MSIVYTSPDGDLQLFHRGDSPKLYCRLRRPDGEGWIQRSRRCLDTGAALKRAREWHDELRFRARLGLSADPKQFAMVADRYLEGLRREVALGLRPARHLRDYEPVVSRYLKPFFGRMLIDEIDNTTIDEYRRWRDAYWLTGPGSRQGTITYRRGGKEIRRPIRRGAPSKSTLIGEDVVLRGIFHTALKAGFVKD